MDTLSPETTCAGSLPRFESPTTSDQALECLNHGNQLFADWVAKESGKPDFELRTGLVDPANVAKQSPFGVVIGCSDARFPLRAALGQRANNLFEIRVAGNVLAEECLGSVDYALLNLPSIKTLVVLGHTHCGAVTAAVDAYLKPASVNSSGLSVGLRAIVQRLLGSVAHSSKVLEEVLKRKNESQNSTREQLIEAAIYVHAATSALDLLEQVKQTGRSDVSVLHGVFDLKDYRIRSTRLDADGTDALSPGLSPAPQDVDALEQLGFATAAAISELASC